MSNFFGIFFINSSHINVKVLSDLSLALNASSILSLESPVTLALDDHIYSIESQISFVDFISFTMSPFSLNPNI